MAFFPRYQALRPANLVAAWRQEHHQAGPANSAYRAEAQPLRVHQAEVAAFPVITELQMGQGGQVQVLRW